MTTSCCFSGTHYNLLVEKTEVALYSNLSSMMLLIQLSACPMPCTVSVIPSSAASYKPHFLVSFVFPPLCMLPINTSHMFSFLPYYQIISGYQRFLCFFCKSKGRISAIFLHDSTGSCIILNKRKIRVQKHAFECPVCLWVFVATKSSNLYFLFCFQQIPFTFSISLTLWFSLFLLLFFQCVRIFVCLLCLPSPFLYFCPCHLPSSTVQHILPFPVLV